MPLSIWTIYRYPKDFTDKFVARRFVLDHPTNHYYTADTLEQVREFLPHGLTRIPRNDTDPLA